VTAGPLVAVFADESCLGNGREGENPGGAGSLIEFRARSGELIRRDVWISERATTNNRMALRSVIETFTAISSKGNRFRVIFTTDSRYIVDGLTKWVHDWSRRGWRRKSGVIENLELWKAAVRAAAPHAVQWRWVRGHDGHAQNEYANHLATRAAADQTQSGGLVESGFSEWILAAATGRAVRVPMRPDPFPDEESFRGAPSLPAAPPESPFV
jgi:ribonuclease HI